MQNNHSVTIKQATNGFVLTLETQHAPGVIVEETLIAQNLNDVLEAAREFLNKKALFETSTKPVPPPNRIVKEYQI